MTASPVDHDSPDARVLLPMAHVLKEHLARLRELYNHPNRLLHYDTLLSALLLAMHDPACRTLRALDDLSQTDALQEALPPDARGRRFCRSTISDAMSRFEAHQLLPIIEQLTKQVPALRQQDDDLHALLKRIIAMDGSVFTIAADVAWAIAATRSNGKPGRQIRLDLQLDALRFLPEDFFVAGAEHGSESASFARRLQAGVIYVADRNFADFKFMHAVFDIGSDLVVRLKNSSPNFIAVEEKPLTDADRAHNVVSDRVGHVPGSAGSPGFGEMLLREIVLIDPKSGKQVRLLTSLLDVPARTIGQIYRHRWLIEIFFRWLKCVAKFEHLFSESHNGITLQFYVAVILALLTYLQTGRAPSVSTMRCLRWVSCGMMSVAAMQQVLARHERERELDRARRARKRLEKPSK